MNAYAAAPPVSMELRCESAKRGLAKTRGQSDAETSALLRSDYPAKRRLGGVSRSTRSLTGMALTDAGNTVPTNLVHTVIDRVIHSLNILSQTCSDVVLTIPEPKHMNTVLQSPAIKVVRSVRESVSEAEWAKRVELA